MLERQYKKLNYIKSLYSKNNRKANKNQKRFFSTKVLIKDKDIPIKAKLFSYKLFLTNIFQNNEHKCEKDAFIKYFFKYARKKKLQNSMYNFLH